MIFTADRADELSRQWYGERDARGCAVAHENAVVRRLDANGVEQRMEKARHVAARTHAVHLETPERIGDRGMRAVSGRHLDQLHHGAAERTIADTVEHDALHARGCTARLRTERFSRSIHQHDCDRAEHECGDEAAIAGEPCHFCYCLAQSVVEGKRRRGPI